MQHFYTLSNSKETNKSRVEKTNFTLDIQAAKTNLSTQETLALMAREYSFPCLVLAVRRFPSSSQSIHFGDVYEANGRETNLRLDHVTRNALAARNVEA